MKKLCAAMVLMFMAAAFFTPVMAEDSSSHQKMKGMGSAMHQDGKCPMCGMMMGQMMQKSLVAVDGGVVVMAGNHLMKYDKDLNMVKEAELNIDMKKMHEEMMKMKKDCPMSDKEQK